MKFTFILVSKEERILEAESKEDAINKIEKGDIGEQLTYIGWDYIDYTIKEKK